MQESSNNRYGITDSLQDRLQGKRANTPFSRNYKGPLPATADETVSGEEEDDDEEEEEVKPPSKKRKRAACKQPIPPKS